MVYEMPLILVVCAGDRQDATAKVLPPRRQDRQVFGGLLGVVRRRVGRLTSWGVFLVANLDRLVLVGLEQLFLS